MAWIESHQTLARHPKTRKLARLLDISVPQTIGHLHCLWWWAMDYAQDGDLSDYDCTDVADAALWEGDADAFVAALAECGAGGGIGFLELGDSGYIIHDWQDYAGRLVEKRKANAERMRIARASNKEVSATHVQRTNKARAGATVPNRTIPTIPTIPTNIPAVAAAPDGTQIEFDPFFEDVWRKYPTREGASKIGKTETRAAVFALGPAAWPDVRAAVVNYAASGRMPVDPIRFFKSKEYPAGLWRQFVTKEKISETTNGSGPAGGSAEKAPVYTADGRRLLNIAEALAQHTRPKGA